jgi:hypothetical protein
VVANAPIVHGALPAAHRRSGGLFTDEGFVALNGEMEITRHV